MAKILSLVSDVNAKSALKWAMGGLSAALAIGVGVGCSSSTSSDPYPTSDSWASALATAECDVVFNECGDNESACVTQRTTIHQEEAASRTTGTRKYNSGNVQACLDATTAALKDTPVSATDKATMDDKCERVFEGQTAALAACSSDYDCTGSNICDPVKLACGPQNTIADGQQCANIGDECGANEYCGKSGASYVCTTRPSLGEACSGDTMPVRAGRLLQRLALHRHPADRRRVHHGFAVRHGPHLRPVQHLERLVPLRQRRALRPGLHLVRLLRQRHHAAVRRSRRHDGAGRWHDRHGRRHLDDHGRFGLGRREPRLIALSNR